MLSTLLGQRVHNQAHLTNTSAEFGKAYLSLLLEAPFPFGHGDTTLPPFPLTPSLATLPVFSGTFLLP